MEAMLKHAQDVLRMEAEAILELVPRVDENFAAAVKLILDCQGRTVITGMGKSGLIDNKQSVLYLGITILRQTENASRALMRRMAWASAVPCAMVLM